MDPRHWTQEEIEYLEDNYGKTTLKNISDGIKKKYGKKRTVKAIKHKVNELKLGGTKENASGIIPTEIARILGMEKTAIYDWIRKGQLKAKKKVLYEDFKNWYVEMKDLMEFLKNNPNKWDSKKVERFALGEEPEWMIQKRKEDMKTPPKYEKWTEEDLRKGLNLFLIGHTYKEISKELNRPYKSVLNMLYLYKRKKIGA